MTVRKVVTRRSNHYRGYFPSLKNKKPVPWESQLEGALFRLLELSPAVIGYVPQPSEERVPSLQGYFKYSPDVQVFLADGREWWFEVKPHDRLKIASVRQRLDAAERYFNATARNFSVITEKLICSGLMKPDTHLGENARHIEVSDDQATSCLFR